MQHPHKIFVITSIFIFAGLGIVFGALAFTQPKEPLVIQASASKQETWSTPVTSPIANNTTATEATQPQTQETKTEPTPAPAVPAPATTPKPTPKQNKVTTQSTTTTPAAPTKCGGTFTQEFMCLLNEYRASAGKTKLSYNSGLASVSLSYSTVMSETNTFSHIDANGDRFSQRCAAAGITCAGENLAEGFTSAQNLLDMWKASGSHNENLLRGFTTAGLGIKDGYATLLFK